MAAKTILFLCAQALVMQSISAQWIGAGYPALAAAPLAATPCGAGLGYADRLGYVDGFGYADGLGYGAWGITPATGLAASHGPGLAIASASLIPPVGVSVASDNAIEGPLAVAGALPFLGTVALEGALPTAGAGNVAYNCGTGAVGIIAEDIAAPLGLAAPFGLAAPLGLATGPIGYAGNLGYGALGAPLGGCGCGARLY